ncbi:MAG: Holliday junction resolvase RuvX [Candidatus Nanopelagicales bacterium]
MPEGPAGPRALGQEGLSTREAGAERPGVRAGVRIGVDVGSVRIGVASSDATGTLAVPVCTVARGAGDIAELLSLAREFGALEFIVGLPLSLRGDPGAAARTARAFAADLAAAGSLPVRLVDERFTTVTAVANLRAAGRGSRVARKVVDQEAAVLIVTYALDRERASGEPAGELVGEPG